MRSNAFKAEGSLENFFIYEFSTILSFGPDRPLHLRDLDEANRAKLYTDRKMLRAVERVRQRPRGEHSGGGSGAVVNPSRAAFSMGYEPHKFEWMLPREIMSLLSRSPLLKGVAGQCAAKPAAQADGRGR